MPATIPSKSLILKRQACKGTASNAKDKPALGAKNDLGNKKRLKGLAAAGQPCRLNVNLH